MDPWEKKVMEGLRAEIERLKKENEELRRELANVKGKL